LPNAATSPAADDFILLSGTANGARKISRSDFIAAIASQIVAAPSTYKIATLDGADKLTSSQDPSQSVSYLGGHDMVANSPALADGSGTAGDTYYVTNPGTRNYGSGNITAQEGDALVYSGSVWQLVEGIANILDGISTASTARTTLEVNSKDEDAQAYALKTTAPALYFNGTASVIEVADDDKFSFTDGTNDLPFSISFWLKSGTTQTGSIVSKNNSSTVLEWVVQYTSGPYLRLGIYTTGGSTNYIRAYTSVTIPSNEWVHVAFTYDGSADATGINAYVNGVASNGTRDEVGTYAGMTNTAAPVWIGRSSTGGYLSAGEHIRQLSIFNRELTSTEVAELARGNDLGFADEWAGANGGIYTSDFTSDSTDGWIASGGTRDATSTVGGDSDNVQMTLNTSSGAHYIYQPSVFSGGKRYRVELEYYLPSTNSNVDGILLREGVGTNISGVSTLSTQDAWTRYSFEFTATPSVATGSFYLYALDGGNSNVTDAGGDDTYAIRNVTITEIGTLADFRAEDYNESASKLLDRSTNNFVGVGTSVTLTGNQRHISADTIDLKNLPTSSAGLSAGEVWSNGGVLTVV